MTRGTKIGIVVAIAAIAVVAVGLSAVGLGVAGWVVWRSSAVTEQQVAVQQAQMQAEVAKLQASVAQEAVAAAPAASADGKPLAERRQEAVARGIAYLVKEQGEDGSWGKGNAGITSLCTQALLASGKTAADPNVSKALGFLLKSQKPDGGIYGEADLKIYTSSIALSVLVKADPKAYADTIDKVKAYLIKNQWDEEESIDKSNPWYGGIGYGKHERPDLSNTQYFVQAMHDAGVPKDNPLWAKVAVFVSRTQNRSESNDTGLGIADDGSFFYSPAGKAGESKAETVTLPDGRKGLKGYGSMTYAGFKSFMYAHLKKDDPRVTAAMEWIRKHWTFDENPDLGQQGLYYYYETAARALAAWGEDKVLDARRRPHDWKAELSEAVLKRQRPDGSWINEADRWFEGFGPVTTSYCLNALAECK